jgi:hypothetical protein
VYSLVYEQLLKRRYTKKFVKFLRKIKYANWRAFYAFHNFHTQHRRAWNTSRAYLVNSRLWYFQKKQFIKVPQMLKYQEFNFLPLINNINLIKSKLIDYIKKI